MKLIDQALNRIFENELGCKTIKNVSGASSLGMLNQCFIYETDKGRFFVKVNDANRLTMYEAEARGLQSLKATETLRVPAPLFWGQEEEYSILILEYIALSNHTPHSQKELGMLLAKMHLKKGPAQFGYDLDNTIGTTPQKNPWSDNWIDFFIKYRLEFQLELLVKKFGDTEIMTRGTQFLEKYSSFFRGVKIVPSLLHGDLWSGNTASDEKGKPIVYDPAVYYGHHEADFGILLMFGGFFQEFFEAYHHHIPKEPGFEERQMGYQLYHFLNHYNLFGSSYRPSCMSILSRI
jgi:fructosamine-3-kinase